MKLPITHTVIRYEEDIVLVRNKAKEIAKIAGLNLQEQTKFTTGVSEISRNAFQYAGGGTVHFEVHQNNGKPFLWAIIKDNGPGIENLNEILNGKYKSEHGMGLGIIGTKKLVDYFDIKSTPGKGTTVIIAQSLPPEISINAKTVSQWIERISKEKPKTDYEELRAHNEELIKLLEEINRKDQQLKAQLEELERTNTGIIALHTELKRKNEQLEKANKLLIEEIEERKKAEEKYRILVENIHECIILAVNRKVIFANPSVRDILGYEPKELYGKDLYQLFSDQTIKDKMEQLFKERENERFPIKNMEVNLERKDSSLLNAEMTVTKLTYNKENSCLIMIRDIKTRKLLEEEKLKGKKFDSLRILIGGIAHDFNNLLTAILGNLAICKMKLGKESELIKFIEEAEKASLMARDLTYKFLNISNSGKPILKKQDIRETIQKAVESALLGSNIQYTIYIQNNLWKVKCDISQLQQAILNVTFNAREAVEKKEGEIQVRAENITVKPDEKPQIEPGDYVMITIKDTGEGIKEENMGKIFDPYFSTKERASAKGMGLGLTIAYSIVRNHNGYIEIQSKLGHGTTVNIYFPAEKE